MNTQTQKMLAFLSRELNCAVTVDTPLVSSGLVDSLALVNILVELEAITDRSIAAERVQPRDLETVRDMMLTAERFGSPRRTS